MTNKKQPPKVNEEHFQKSWPTTPDTRHKILDNVRERSESNVIRNTMPPPINPYRDEGGKDKK